MTRTRRSIELSPEERQELEVFTKIGKRSVKLVKGVALILALDASEGLKPDAEAESARRIRVSRQAVPMVKKDFTNAMDLNAFLQRKRRDPPVTPKVTGELEAHSIALACGKPPAGDSTWTLRLLADTDVALPYRDSLSPMTVSGLLKTERNPQVKDG